MRGRGRKQEKEGGRERKGRGRDRKERSQAGIILFKKAYVLRVHEY